MKEPTPEMSLKAAVCGLGVERRRSKLVFLRRAVVICTWDDMGDAERWLEALWQKTRANDERKARENVPTGRVRGGRPQ